MTKRGDDGQLTLKLRHGVLAEDAQSVSKKGKLVHFVDAATRDIRQDAVRRVRQSGIFELLPIDPRKR